MESELCIQCKLFYGLHRDNKCYRCANNLPKLFSQYDPKYRKLLSEYINTFLPPKDYLDTLTFACKNNKIKIIQVILDEIYKMDKFLTAKIAKPLLRDLGQDSIMKAGLIMPYILDTWNITDDNGFKGIEDCYFNKAYRLDFPNKIPLEKQYIPDRKKNRYKQITSHKNFDIQWTGYEC